MKLKDRVAIVTGGAQGIGKAIAEKLSDEGASVVIADINEEGAKAVAEGLSGEGLGIRADVSNPDDVQAMVDATVDRFGRVDVLVNNAGMTRDNLLFRMSEDDWDQVLDVNLKSVFLLTRAVQKHMVDQRAGAVVNLSSRSALGNRGQANYAAAKAGIQGLTATLALELGPFGIRVNAVAPGYVATAMTEATAFRVGSTPDEHQAAASSVIPLRRVARPDEIASVVAFFASDDASYVSGQTLYVNGGGR